MDCQPRSLAEPDTACGGQVRDGVVAMLDAWAGVTPAERLLPALADYLASAKAGGEGKVAQEPLQLLAGL